MRGFLDTLPTGDWGTRERTPPSSLFVAAAVALLLG